MKHIDASTETGLMTTPPYTMPNSDRVIRDFVIFEETTI